MSCNVSRLKGHAVTDAHARARVERDQVDAKVDLPTAGAVPPQRGHRPGRRRVARARRLAHARSRGGSALSRAGVALSRVGVALSRVGVALSEQVLWERACVREVSEHARCQDGLGRLAAARSRLCLASRCTRTLSRGLLEQSPGESSKEPNGSSERVPWVGGASTRLGTGTRRPSPSPGA